jgi:hypothetical protein
VGLVLPDFVPRRRVSEQQVNVMDEESEHAGLGKLEVISSHALSREMRDYHQLSQNELDGKKRTSRHLSSFPPGSDLRIGLETVNFPTALEVLSLGCSGKTSLWLLRVK